MLDDGSALNFGASQGGVGGARDGTPGVGSSTVHLPGDGGAGVGSGRGGGDDNGGSVVGGGHGGLPFRTRIAPPCNNGSLALPCEADAEYTSEIA
ncbi:hypothetical protein FHG87_017784 [Trinorchestia longiramus]|nr:hypothetical protein FHG87_017784 [Trinorchestia longiramus]